jgi:hypothetical protein
MATMNVEESVPLPPDGDGESEGASPRLPGSRTPTVPRKHVCELCGACVQAQLDYRRYKLEVRLRILETKLAAERESQEAAQKAARILRKKEIESQTKRIEAHNELAKQGLESGSRGVIAVMVVVGVAVVASVPHALIYGGEFPHSTIVLLAAIAAVALISFFAFVFNRDAKMSVALHKFGFDVDTSKGTSSDHAGGKAENKAR